MAMKFHGSDSVHDGKKVWQDKLISPFRKRLVFNPETIADLKRGLDLCSQLRLLPDLSFNHQQLGDLLLTSSNECHRPFTHVV